MFFKKIKKFLKSLKFEEKKNKLLADSENLKTVEKISIDSEK